MEVSTVWQVVFALCVGISLSAACGFRVFAPLLIVSLAVRGGAFSVAESFQWIGSDVALLMLLTATIVEVLAYYIPFVDNLLDTVSVPLAMIAGAIVMTGMLGELPPALRWGFGIAFGSASAGLVQTSTAAVRGGSTAATAGAANRIFATIENFFAFVFSVLAIDVPVICVILLVVLLMIVIRVIIKRRRAALDVRS